MESTFKLNFLKSLVKKDYQNLNSDGQANTETKLTSITTTISHKKL